VSLTNTIWTTNKRNKRFDTNRSEFGPDDPKLFHPPRFRGRVSWLDIPAGRL
jgi:hypothetical protein